MKRIKFLPIVFCMAMLVGCTSSPQPEDMTLGERIETAETFSEITDCIGEYNRNKSNYSETENASLNKAIGDAEIAYMFSDGNLNGTYYFSKIVKDRYEEEDFGKETGDEVSYKIVVYAVSGDEIYIVPAEDAPADMKDIPNLSNVSEYKYKAKWDRDSDAFYPIVTDYMGVSLVRNSDDYEVSIRCYEYGCDFSIYNYLPQQLDANGESIWPYSQDYYSNQSDSQEMAQIEYDKYIAEKEEEEELSKSTPKIGMTKNQVTKTSWGTPDKKNIDTYSWGTKEQWVYRSKGYVYFENGVVTSVSTSE